MPYYWCIFPEDIKISEKLQQKDMKTESQNGSGLLPEKETNGDLQGVLYPESKNSHTFRKFKLCFRTIIDIAELNTYTFNKWGGERLSSDKSNVIQRKSNKTKNALGISPKDVFLCMRFRTVCSHISAVWNNISEEYLPQRSSVAWAISLYLELRID